jgi:ABC-type transport system involved in multi-copper enzyme maturation permease subunit
MTVLPIVERELRTASRRKGTYWNRAISAAVAGTVFGLIFLVGASEPSHTLGKSLFTALSVIFLGVSLLTGVVYTADSISEEKREGTLGLLFLTDLRGYDVVLGKLAASSLGAIYAVLAIMPVLAIPLLMGGVSPAEFGRVVLVLVNTLFLSLAAGVMVSGWMRQALTSMAMTLGVVVGVNVLPPLLAVWIAYTTRGEPPEPLLVPSVGYALAVAHESLFRTRPGLFVVSVVVTHLLAWAFLILASERTRSAWQESPVGDTSTWRERLALWLRGNPERRRRWRAVALDVNPSYWLGGRSWYKGWIVWVAIGGLGLLWLACHVEWGREWSGDAVVALMSVLVLHTLLRWWVAGEACVALGPDRKNGSLELLLCTGLRVREIVRGRLMALHRQFFWPAVGVLVVDLWMLSIVLGQASAGDDMFFWLSFFACLVAVLAVDMLALAWLGLWWGLVCRKASRALLRSATVIFGLPWAALILLLILLIVSQVNPPKPEEFVFLLAYATVALGVSLLACRWAQGRLLNELRVVAAGGKPAATTTNKMPAIAPVSRS